MVNFPDALSNRHVHEADAIGFRVLPAVLLQLGITEPGPFTGRAVRCPTGKHNDYVMVANANCDGRNVSVSDFEAAVAAAIIACYS